MNYRIKIGLECSHIYDAQMVVSVLFVKITPLD